MDRPGMGIGMELDGIGHFCHALQRMSGVFLGCTDRTLLPYFALNDEYGEFEVSPIRKTKMF